MSQGRFLKDFPWLRGLFPPYDKEPARPSTLPDVVTLTQSLDGTRRYIQGSVGGFVPGTGGLGATLASATGTGTVTATIGPLSTLAVHYLLMADVYHSAAGNFGGELRVVSIEGDSTIPLANINLTPTTTVGNSAPIVLPRPIILPGGVGLVGRFFALPAASTVTLTAWFCSVPRGEVVPVLG